MRLVGISTKNVNKNTWAGSVTSSLAPPNFKIMKEFNFKDQWTEAGFAAAMKACNDARDWRFNHGDTDQERTETITAETPDAVKPRKRGRPKKIKQ